MSNIPPAVARMWMLKTNPTTSKAIPEMITVSPICFYPRNFCVDSDRRRKHSNTDTQDGPMQTRGEHRAAGCRGCLLTSATAEGVRRLLRTKERGLAAAVRKSVSCCDTWLSHYAGREPAEIFTAPSQRG